MGTSGWTEVAGVLGYDPGDPFAVRIRFGGRSGGGDDEGVEWLVARDLLHTGLTCPAGDGDVRLWPARGADAVFLELRAPSGHALFELSRSVLTDFLADTERVVPRGSEGDLMDADPALHALVQGEWPDPSAR